MPGRDLARPWPQRRLSTLYLRVPNVDWAAVTGGHKREFRSSGQALTQVWSVQCPTPVRAYTVTGPPQGRVHRGPELMVLERTWREPLAAISPESLEAEGFESVGDFRRYYIARTGKLYMPLKEVQVYKIRPWTPLDEQRMAYLLLDRLFRDRDDR